MMKSAEFVDYGVMKSVRDLFIQKSIGIVQGISDENILIMTPPEPQKNGSVISIELEGTWSPYRKMPDRHAQVCFKIMILSDHDNGEDSIVISRQINRILDKEILPLTRQKEAFLNLRSSIVEFKKAPGQPRKVELFYEAIVRKANFAEKYGYQTLQE